MNDREELAAALDRLENEVALWGEIDLKRDPFMADIKLGAAAARERLAQLPGKCDMCGGVGTYAVTFHPLYPSISVERIAELIYSALRAGNNLREVAVAVLDALNTEPL